MIKNMMSSHPKAIKKGKNDGQTIQGLIVCFVFKN